MIICVCFIKRFGVLTKGCLNGIISALLIEKRLTVRISLIGKIYWWTWSLDPEIPLEHGVWCDQSYVPTMSKQVMCGLPHYEVNWPGLKRRFSIFPGAIIYTTVWKRIRNSPCLFLNMSCHIFGAVSSGENHICHVNEFFDLYSSSVKSVLLVPCSQQKVQRSSSACF